MSPSLQWTRDRLFPFSSNEVLSNTDKLYSSVAVLEVSVSNTITTLVPLLIDLAL